MPDHNSGDIDDFQSSHLWGTDSSFQVPTKLGNLQSLPLSWFTVPSALAIWGPVFRTLIHVTLKYRNVGIGPVSFRLLGVLVFASIN